MDIFMDYLYESMDVCCQIKAVMWTHISVRDLTGLRNPESGPAINRIAGNFTCLLPESM